MQWSTKCSLVKMGASMPTDEVGQLQRPHGLICAQLHAAVNVLSAAHALHEVAAELS